MKCRILILGLRYIQEFRISVNQTTPEQCSKIDSADRQNDGQLNQFRVVIHYLSGAVLLHFDQSKGFKSMWCSDGKIVRDHMLRYELSDDCRCNLPRGNPLSKYDVANWRWLVLYSIPIMKLFCYGFLQ